MDQPMEMCQSGALNITGAVNEQHICTKKCVYFNEFANVYHCQTSGQIHICDNTCTQKVWYDPYSSICRLSKRVFANEESPGNQFERKRSVHGQEALTNQAGLKRTCSERVANF
ncbi:hypothetical protein Ndes2526A_g08436 [Nannochloris sp. 'desiccata']